MVVFTQEAYGSMRSFVMKFILEGRPIAASNCGSMDFDADAVGSLYSQLMVRRMKNDANKTKGLMGLILSRLGRNNCGGGSSGGGSTPRPPQLAAIAKELNCGSYKAAKVVLESVLGKGVSVAQFIEQPSLLEDVWLRQNVLDCIAADPLCSLEADLTRECAGKEFEALLLQQLRAKNMCFETEAELRSRGKPKTPDILFLIPMGVMYNAAPPPQQQQQQQQQQHGLLRAGAPPTPLSSPPLPPPPSSAAKAEASEAEVGNDEVAPPAAVGRKAQRQPSTPTQAQQQPFVVNWIDSKGMFADEETFNENYEQLKSYVNRYGSGMVIYWHGYVSSLSRWRDDSILVCDRFPEDWIFPTGEVADGRAPEFDTFP